jgi:trigger factor
VKSSLEALEGNKVKLYVEVEEDEFETDINKAFKAIAREVRLPGFRNGKAPRKVLEARIGVGAAREEALRTAVPEYLAKAVREHEVDLIARPEVEITDGEESGPVEFDATCEVRPVITVPGYGGLRVELPSLDVDDDELAEAQAVELRKSGSLVDVDRPIESGDFVVLDMVATRDGEDVMGLNTDDWSYEVGQGWVADDFDDHLVGATAGDVLEFTATPKGTEIEADFTVKVTAVQEMELPEATDDWVSDNIGEFDTVEAWRASLAESLREVKLDQARRMLYGEVTAALAGLVEDEPPKPMVDADLNQRVQGTMQQFQAQGIDFGQWMAATGQEPDQFVESMRGQSEQAVKVDLALRAVAEAESFDVEGHELDAEYARMAMQYGQKAKEIRKVYEKNDMVPDLIAQIRKSKSLDWLMHHVEFVDPAGASIDRDELLGHTHDHDHDHDADAADDDAAGGDAADPAAADDDVAAQAGTPDSPTDNEENDES